MFFRNVAVTMLQIVHKVVRHYFLVINASAFGLTGSVATATYFYFPYKYLRKFDLTDTANLFQVTT